MKKVSALVALPLVLAACGGTPEEFDDQVELAQIEQGLIGYSTGGPTSGGKTTGVRTANSRTSCDGTSGEACLVPNYASKSIKFGMSTPEFQPREQAALRSGVARVDAQTNWAFTEGSGAGFAFQIGSGTISGSASSNNMDSFLHWFPNSPVVTLNEGLPGSYQAFNLIGCNVDILKARIKYPNIVDREKFLIHVGGACAMMSIGAGMRIDANAANSFSSRNVATLNASRTLTPGEKCRLNNYQLGGAPAYAVDGGACLGLL